MGEVTIKTNLTWLIYTDKNLHCDGGQGDKKIEKNCPIFQKVAQTVSKPKKAQNIYNKAQFECPKQLHETTFEGLNT